MRGPKRSSSNIKRDPFISNSTPLPSSVSTITAPFSPPTGYNNYIAAQLQEITQAQTMAGKSEESPCGGIPGDADDHPHHSHTASEASSTSEDMGGMGREAKKLMTRIKDLRTLGIEDTDLPLPKICVVGDQSTGKSSLIEGISEIRVPRAADVCTRCPLEINLSECQGTNPQWTCTVTLVKKYYFDSTVRKLAPTRTSPFGPWNAQIPPEETHFATLASKAEVGEVLHLAQLATLNPTEDPEEFKPGCDVDVSIEPKAKFSPNVIKLDICGPGLPNLCFYDLPGVISQDEEQYAVSLVENLVLSYIKAPNCIILNTLTMNTDAANSKAASIIKRTPGAIERTVGVLTKPDLVGQLDSVNQWSAILNGNKFPLRLGYFVVKNSIDDTLSSQQARMQEEQFFQNTRPFNSELRRHRDNFGTRKLRDSLSGLLTAEIEKCLPDIDKRIIERLSDVAIRLRRLPKPVEGNVSLGINNKITQFETILKREIDGGSFGNLFFTTWLTSANKFRNTMACSRPLLVFSKQSSLPIRTKSDISDHGSLSPQAARLGNGEVIDLLESDNETTPMTTPVKRKRAGQPDPSERPRKRSNALEDLDGFKEGKSLSKRFTVDDIRAYINEVNTGIPGSSSPQVTEKIYLESVSHWNDLLQKFLEDATDRTGSLVFGNMESSFHLWKHTQLYDVVEQAVVEFLKQIYHNSENALKEILDLETSKVMTLDAHAKQDEEREAINLLEAASQSNEIKRLQTLQTDKLNSGQPLSKKQLDDIESHVKSLPVPFHAEIREMATARSYYHIASRRFADFVGLSINKNLFQQCRDELPNALRKNIGLEREDANERCKVLLTVDREIEKERTRLYQRQAALEQAQQWLAELAGRRPMFGQTQAEVGSQEGV